MTDPVGSETRELMAHLYRGQLGHADTWRRRIDATTNWAVVLTATLLTWIFSSPSHPHYVLLVGIVGVSFFLIVEARRYRQYDVWRYRVRMLEEHMFANAIGDAREPDPEWRLRLRDDLRQPVMKIPFLEALARRLRRVYLGILGVLLIAWLLRVLVFAPEGASLLDSMAIEDIPGSATAIVVALFTLTIVGVAAAPMKRRAKGEIEDGGDFDHKHD